MGIGLGVSLFSLAQSDGEKEEEEHSTKLKGLFWIAVYLTCDSFTSQWQVGPMLGARRAGDFHQSAPWDRRVA